MAGAAMLVLALVAIAAVLLIPRDADEADRAEEERGEVEIPVQRNGEQDVPRTDAERADRSGAEERS